MTQSIDEQLLPVIQNNNLEVQYDSEKGAYVLSQYEEFLQTLDVLDDKVDKYVYQPDDRKSVKTLKAQINKFSASFKNESKEIQSQLFDTFKAQEKEITSRLNSLVTKVSKGIDEEDKRYKREKLESFKNEFDEAKKYYDDLKDSSLEYDDVANSKWLNRSYSENKAITEMNDRMKTLDTLMDSSEQYEFDLLTGLRTLYKNDWDGLAALNSLKSEYATRLREQREAYEAEQQRLAELKERENNPSTETENEEEVQPQETVSIEILESDLALVKRILKKRDVYFKILD